MTFQVILSASLLALVTCHPPQAYESYQPKELELPAKYAFGYQVADPHTGDFKSQVEHADGQSVQGVYTLADSDGTARIVEYADKGHGFHAIVKKVRIAKPSPPLPLPPPPPPPPPQEPAHISYAPKYEHKQYEAPARYAFGYQVADPITGDFKSQVEHADGKSVKGVYSLLEPDGTKRIVEYGDEGHGFYAIVKKEGIPIPPPPPAPKKHEFYGHSLAYAPTYDAGYGTAHVQVATYGAEGFGAGIAAAAPVSPSFGGAGYVANIGATNSFSAGAIKGAEFGGEGALGAVYSTGLAVNQGSEALSGHIGAGYSPAIGAGYNAGYGAQVYSAGIGAGYSAQGQGALNGYALEGYSAGIGAGYNAQGQGAVQGYGAQSYSAGYATQGQGVAFGGEGYSAGIGAGYGAGLGAGWAAGHAGNGYSAGPVAGIASGFAAQYQGYNNPAHSVPAGWAVHGYKKW